MAEEQQSVGGSHWWTFFRQFRSNFQTTGSVAPSSRFLAKAITQQAADAPRPLRILEAGPGTGAFTGRLIELLQPGDSLLLVELNDRFVDVLRHRLDTEPRWKSKRDQVRILHDSVQEIPQADKFEAIVCGLPFNNFEPALVRELFALFIDRLEGAGTFSFFEYLAIRELKSPFVGRTERERLAAVAAAIKDYLDQYEESTARVALNFPPAVVHRLRKS